MTVGATALACAALMCAAQQIAPLTPAPPQAGSLVVARQLVRDGVVTSISAETVRQILLHHRLKPWRQKMWLSAKVPRDSAFAAQVTEICGLYTRQLRPDEVVLCVDEMTSLQPRPRKATTQARTVTPARLLAECLIAIAQPSRFLPMMRMRKTATILASTTEC